MTNLFTRIKNTITSDLHEMIDQKEEKNPIATLNQYLRESEREVEQIRRMMDRQRKLQDQFTHEYEQAVYMRDKRDQQALVAKKADELSLYEFAIKEKHQYEEQATNLKESLNRITRSIEQLEEKYRTMQYKLKEMHFKRMELMGKENTLRMTHRMNQLLNHDEQNSNRKIRDIERYMERLEAKVSRDYEQLTFDDKIAQLEKDLKAE
ncbi:PspA/IM30 family protein [Bacillaceae bacterium W0354]